jgi:heme-degrading monooxygenase HmoA
VTSKAGYVVVDVWRAKPGMVDEVDRLLLEASERFKEIDGIISVDYAHVDDRPDTYLVIFRYSTREAREAFQDTDELQSTMTGLRQVWDLESPVYRGETFN